MSGFSQFYIQFLQELWSNICECFALLWSIIVKIFYGDWAENGYANLFMNEIPNWNVLDYIAFIIVLIINIGFIALLAVLLFQLIKRYVRFVKREVDKDSLVEEVSLLNQKVVEFLKETNSL